MMHESNLRGLIETPRKTSPSLPQHADADLYRDSLAKLASGVAIISCWDEDEPRGLLVSSLTGLSTNPPRLLFCVQKAASAHDALLDAESVGVSVLTAGGEEEARRFSSSKLTHERFDPDDWSLDTAAPPQLREALVRMAGFVRCRLDAGTHTVFIMDVGLVERREGEPLVYFDRGFRSLAD